MRIALDDATGLPPQLARSRWQPTPAERRRLRKESAHFALVRRAESRYAAQLRNIARHVGSLVRSFRTSDPSELLAALPQLLDTLDRYADALEPWARVAAERLLADVARRDATAWFKTSRDLGFQLRQDVDSTPLGDLVRRFLDDQVALIRSLPIEAGRRVQANALDLAVRGGRFDDLEAAIRDTGHVTASRATLIARTETAKAQSAITRARSESVGVTQYVWRTANDLDVRKTHKRLAGKVFSWDDPPVAEEDGRRHHPGEFPNCRCYAEPVIPETVI